MARIIGNTTATPTPVADWNQTDPNKADYIKNKPEVPSKVSDLTNDAGYINAVDDELSSTSTNPVQNNVVNTAISNLTQLVGDTSVAEQVEAGLNEAKDYTDNRASALNTTIAAKADTSALNSHTGNKSNPHGVTKAQVDLGNVPNVATNDQTPSYTAATTLAELNSGEKLSAAFGKIAKAIKELIAHIGNKSNPHNITTAQIGAPTTAEFDRLSELVGDTAVSTQIDNAVSQKCQVKFITWGAND